MSKSTLRFKKRKTTCKTNFFKIEFELRVIYRSIEEKPVGKSTRNFKAVDQMHAGNVRKLGPKRHAQDKAKMEWA